MSKSHLLLVALLAPALAAPALAAPGDAPPGTADASFRRADWCGTVQNPGLVANPIARPFGATGPRTIFLNRFGGTYHLNSWPTNSATQNAGITAEPGELVIEPLGAEFDWPTISACVEQLFAPYDLRFVETRPASGIYIEAVVSGAGDIGDPIMLGIAAADNQCYVTEAGIGFIFAEAHLDLPPPLEVQLCWTIAHELGHLLGPEHETLATDVMSYVNAGVAPSKSFVDQDATCGTYPGQDALWCPCAARDGRDPSDNLTNSARRLATYVGLRSEPLGLGETCQSGDQCQGGLCVTQHGEMFCTQTCDTASDTCPDGWTCTQAGDIAVCAASRGAGCCDAGSRPGPGAGLLVLGVGVIILRRRRAGARA